MAKAEVAMIRLRRDIGWTDKLRAYKVVLDHAIVGKIREGEEIEMDASPGKHELYLKIDW